MEDQAMITKMTQTAVEKLACFRERLYEWFRYRTDALFNLLDSLCGNTTAQSVVELSLNGSFERKYSSLYDAVANLQGRKEGDRLVPWCDLLEGLLPDPGERPFRLLGVDTTPQPRPYARTLQDRGIVYFPNPSPGNKPISVGHHYSVVAMLPERAAGESPWVVPLSCQRVSTDQKTNVVGREQIKVLLEDDHLPFKEAFTVIVSDSHYSHANFLSGLSGYGSTVVIARFARNRKLYRRASPPRSRHLGHPAWYGAVVKPPQPDTLGTPDEEASLARATRRGRPLTLRLRRWKNLLMHGKRDAPMHDHPLDLISVEALDLDGQPLYTHPLWLVVMGARRHEVTLRYAYEAYAQRYDLEHFFRFGKQRLLITAHQTPVLEHEEAWWTLCCLAAIQLWLAASLGAWMPRPWERYDRTETLRPLLRPTQVQRQFARIIQQIGTPALAPKPRGYSPGRAPGTQLQPRPRHLIIFKNRSPPKKAA